MSNLFRYQAVLFITAATFAVEAFGSYDTRSHGLLSDGLHLLGDGIPFALGWSLLRWEPEADAAKGLESLIVYFNTFFLAAIALYIGGRGVYRLYYPEEIGRSVVYYAVFGIAGNAAQLYFAWGLHGAHHHADTYKSQILHLSADLLSSIAVVAAAGVVVATGYAQADSIASLGVAVITGYAAWQCGKSFLLDDAHAHSHDH